MARSSTNQVMSLDKLVVNALKDKMPHTRYTLTVLRTPQYEKQISDFEKILIKSGKIIKTDDKPEEISKIQVDVNEKFYTNKGSGSNEDESTVKIVKKAETSATSNYEQQTTTGLEWGAGTNIGAQFGLPQVGIQLSGGGSTSFKKTNQTTITESTTTSSTVGQESHHEETVNIPPGHQVKVEMTSYRVKYQLNYTMEYKVQKAEDIRIRYTSIMLCCGLFSSGATLTAANLLKFMPNYRQDEEHVYFTQQGCLRWVADRMEVKKKLELV